MGECFFWYRPTRVVPDQRPLNGRCCCCHGVVKACQTFKIYSGVLTVESVEAHLGRNCIQGSTVCSAYTQHTKYDLHIPDDDQLI